MTRARPAWEGLATLPGPAIREQWETVHGMPAPGCEASLLARQLAWAMQAEQHGGLDKRIERHLQRLCTAHEGALHEVAAPPAAPAEPAAGTRFLREWGGKVHQVERLPNGRYRYGGAEWRSLSGIARHITGARWSGPRFFGLPT